MGTKLAETQRLQENLHRTAVSERTCARRRRLPSALRRKAVIRSISLLGDAIAIVGAHLVAKALAIRLFHVPATALNPHDYVSFYFPFLLIVLFVFERNRQPELRRPEKELELIVKGISLGFLLLVCANFVVFATGFSRYMFVIWYPVTLVLLLAVRHGQRVAYDALWRKRVGQKKTLLIGSAKKLFELQTLLSIQRYRGFELLGIVPVGPPEQLEDTGLPILASLDYWHDAVEEVGAEQVIVALEERSPDSHLLVSEILRQCLSEKVDVQVYSDLFASREFNYELDEFSGFFLFFAAARWSKQLQRTAKATLDVTAGVLGSVLTLVLLPFVALLIKMEDGGPIFFSREFVGQDGRVRHYLKFRTMRTNAHEMMENDPTLKSKFMEKHKLLDDPRITRFGGVLRRYSIDELPQFFSLLTGRLALVGPRVIAHDETERYGANLPKLLSAKAGLTGFWQVMGRQLTTYPERVQMDMFYVDHWSIWLDLWIIAKTFWKVLRAEGAY